MHLILLLTTLMALIPSAWPQSHVFVSHFSSAMSQCGLFQTTVEPFINEAEITLFMKNATARAVLNVNGTAWPFDDSTPVTSVDPVTTDGPSTTTEPPKSSTDAPGTTILGESDGTLKVLVESETIISDANATETNTRSTLNIGLIGGVVAGTVAVTGALGAFIVYRRRMALKFASDANTMSISEPQQDTQYWDVSPSLQNPVYASDDREDVSEV